MRAVAVMSILGLVAGSVLLAPNASAQRPLAEAVVSGDATVQFELAATKEQDDRGRRFWVRDKNRYWSPWFDGRRRKMINFGCTKAPYYDPSPRCTGGRGFHHGLDVAMPCGTTLFAGVRGRVLSPSAPGSLGSAYGPWAFRIRSPHFKRDIVIGHVRKVYVRPGQRVARGQVIARASDAGAPDGCHLHFEVRPYGGSYSSAVRPGPLLQLSRTR